jgi:hypothetical protein
MAKRIVFGERLIYNTTETWKFTDFLCVGQEISYSLGMVEGLGMKLRIAEFKQRQDYVDVIHHEWQPIMQIKVQEHQQDQQPKP